MRRLLVPLLAAHGLIHLLGLPLLWGGTLAGMSGATRVPVTGVALRVAGAGWLVAGLALLAAAYGVAFRRAWWRPVTLAALALSQALIVVWWQDARVGTVANVLILTAVVWRAGLAAWKETRIVEARP